MPGLGNQDFCSSFVIVAVRAILRYPTVLHEQGTKMFMAGSILLIIVPLDDYLQILCGCVLSNSRHHG